MTLKNSELKPFKKKVLLKLGSLLFFLFQFKVTI